MTRMSQVFSNLLNNAAKYSERGGRNRFDDELANDCVLVHVRDQGIGIATDQLQRIFEMFTQVIDRSNVRKVDWQLDSRWSGDWLRCIGSVEVKSDGVAKVRSL